MSLPDAGDVEMTKEALLVKVEIIAIDLVLVPPARQLWQIYMCIYEGIVLQDVTHSRFYIATAPYVRNLSVVSKRIVDETARYQQAYCEYAWTKGKSRGLRLCTSLARSTVDVFLTGVHRTGTVVLCRRIPGRAVVL